MFQDPTARTRIINWADFASASVADLRREVGRCPLVSDHNTEAGKNLQDIVHVHL